MLSRRLRIPATPVPTSRNTHMCFGISLPDDMAVDQQLPIAVEPYLDNTVVMHHINFWPCDDIPSTLFASFTGTTARCRRGLVVSGAFVA